MIKLTATGFTKRMKEAGIKVIGKTTCSTGPGEKHGQTVLATKEITSMARRAAKEFTSTVTEVCMMVTGSITT